MQALRQLPPELDLFLERYSPLCGRDEAQAHADRFVQGLLLGGDRRSVENIAEAIEGGVVRSLQKFLAQAPGSDEAVVEELHRHVTEVLGDPDAALNVAETGFPKTGTKSVGVKRPYACGHHLVAEGVGSAPRRRSAPAMRAGPRPSWCATNPWLRPRS